MNMLRQLHTEAKIVHGDIHVENVFIEIIQETRFVLKFIDFGRAGRVVSPWPDRLRLTNSNMRHYMYTQWMIDGHYWAPRDDVMKTIQMLAQLMNDCFEYQAIERYHMNSGYLAQRDFKMNHDI